ncbi:MAG TPA: acyl-CoA dehydrogenase family protein [Stellaceae bacterium]|nr:acyl-CoA dehydrogenase family protein [Stellaceae bacterium]
MTEALPAEELFARVDKLAPVIAASADESERLRRLAPAAVETLSHAGLFRLWVPRSLGGAEVDAATLVRIVEAISRIDGAAGWCVTIASNSSLPAGYLPSAAARHIYGDDPLLVTGGTWPPLGQAVAVNGGYRVTGRWPFASGCHHTRWLEAGCRIIEDGTPRLEANGSPVVRILYLPASSCEILDTWDTSGLRGTGSHDFTAQDVFVPTDHTVSFHEPPVEKGPLYAFPIIVLSWTSIAAVSLGIARHALDILTKVSQSKVAMRSQQALSQGSVVQIDLGRAEGLLRSGRALLHQTIDEAWQIVTAGKQLAVGDRAMLSLAATHATSSAIEAVDLACRAAGSASLYTNSKLERCQRDVRAAGTHIAVAYPNYELVGQALLGFNMRMTTLMRADERYDY